MWHVGYNFLIFWLQCIQRRVVSGSVNVGLRHYVGTLRRVPIMTSHCDVICDITWHMCQGYKMAWCRVMGDTLVQLSLGKEVHMHAWIDMLVRPTLREPTSFEYNWLGCSNLPVCIHTRRRTHYTLRTARECCVLPKEYRLYRTIMPFGWCPCALFIELLFTSPEA